MQFNLLISIIVAMQIFAASGHAADAAPVQNGDTGTAVMALRSVAPSGGNMNGAAKNAGGSNASGMIGNVVAAGAYVAASDLCKNKMLCAMAAVSLVQSLLQGQSKKGDDKSAAATQFNPYASGAGGSDFASGAPGPTTVDPLTGLRVPVAGA